MTYLNTYAITRDKFTHDHDHLFQIECCNALNEVLRCVSDQVESIWRLVRNLQTQSTLMVSAECDSCQLTASNSPLWLERVSVRCCKLCTRIKYGRLRFRPITFQWNFCLEAALFWSIWRLAAVRRVCSTANANKICSFVSSNGLHSTILFSYTLPLCIMPPGLSSCMAMRWLTQPQSLATTANKTTIKWPFVWTNKRTIFWYVTTNDMSAVALRAIIRNVRAARINS